jgi:spore coat polysaccharide biosynthesis protein SpsF
MNWNTIAIIQARMASSRLPGKVLLDIGGQPMLGRVVERVRRASTVSQVVVATTIDASDDPVANFCRENAYPCTRGSAQDVLDRYYQAAQLFAADIVVRVTADCPVIDPGLIDDAVKALFEDRSGELGVAKSSFAFDTSNLPIATRYDFVANRLPPPWGRTYPIGLDVEACTFAGLKTAWKEATLPHQREHVMPFFYDHPGRFRIRHLNHTEDAGAYRWTVDTPQDLELLRLIYSHFAGRDDFSWLEVLALFKQEPELGRINAQVRHKDYREVDERG